MVKAKKKKVAPKKKKAAPKKKSAPKKKGFDRKLPAVLAALHELPFDYEEGIDFEPYDAFQSAEDNESWIRAWTGNQELTGEEYRVFGQDGTGGYAAFWVLDPSADLLAQPIVFFGSEGEIGVVARNFGEYLWILAAGIGPLEAVSYGAEGEAKTNAAFAKFAAKHAPKSKTTAAAALAAAKKAHPKFEERIRAQVKY